MCLESDLTENNGTDDDRNQGCLGTVGHSNWPPDPVYVGGPYSS